jgi:hypothetical protein
VSTSPRIALVAAFALALSDAGVAAVGPPLLILSQRVGRPGAEVHVVGVNCSRPAAGDELIWRDAYQYANDRHQRPADPPFRRVRLTRVSRTRVEAIFVVLRTDHRGRGIFTLFCGGGHNPFNTFTVTR